ncbi:MAG: outer membrane protein [Desulforhopalus sp.]|jgi:outer membrane protein
MKSIQTVILLGLLLSAGNVTAEEAPLPKSLTVQDAVSFALQDNPDNTIAEHRIAQARASATMVSSSDYPLVNLSAEYGLTDNPMYSFGNILNQGEFNDTIDFNDPGTTDNLQIKAAISYRIYNGGQDRAEKKSANAQVDAMKSNLKKVHQQLSFEVVKTYHAVLQAKKMVTVRQQALDSISAALLVGKARYEAGDLLKQDLLNLELQQSTASEDLIISNHTLELTKRSLLNLLGQKEGTIVLNESDSILQLAPVNTSYQNRSELLTLQRMKDAAIANLEKARGYNRPKIDTFASYQFDNGWELDGNGDSWLAGVRVNYNLFDGHKGDSQVAVAKTKLQELEARIKKTELTLSLDVQQAELNYQQAKKRLSVTEKMVGVAKEATRLARVRFKEGVILSSDLIDFETRLSDAQARHLNANATYQVAIANLRRAGGLDQFSI